MAKCKRCEEPIAWEQDEYGEHWIPMDPDTGERHDCSAYEAAERKDITRCNLCKKEISFKYTTTNGEEDEEPKWIPYEVDGSKPHSCLERNRAWQAEQSQRTGRSQAQLCRNGCGTLVFWNYDVRSKFNKKPLSYEQATNTYHKCPNYKLKFR
jgi:hypothetical protein